MGIDEMWAALQAEDTASRTKKTKKKKAASKVLAEQVKQEVAPSSNAADGCVTEVTTVETVPQQMHFHTRCVMNGSLSERKSSLSAIAQICGDSKLVAAVAESWGELKPVLIGALHDPNSACREQATSALKRLCGTTIFCAADNV